MLISQRLLSEQFAADDFVATGTAFRHLDVITTKHSVEWAEGVSVGEVTIEEADKEDWAGAWALVATVTFDGSVTPAPKVDIVNVNANGRAYRHRITTQVEGGSVTTKISGSA